MNPRNSSSRQSVTAKSPSRTPLALGLVCALAAGLVGSTVLQTSTDAMAEMRPARQITVAPYGNAPVSFADLAEQVRPAVVSIYTTGSKRSSGRKPSLRGLPKVPGLPKDHPLYEFFKRFGEGFEGSPLPMPRRRPVQAQGSGFIISNDGYVVTNNHVVDNAGKIKIGMDDGKRVSAKLIGTDPRTDIALLKIQSNQEFDYVRFTDTPARVGDWVLAVGNPFGLGGTVTAGIVSAMGRDIGSGPYDYLQIDAAVNKGNSGGPAFNLSGEVIGVNTAIFSPSGGNVGIAFAVPAKTARYVVEQLKKHGSVSRGWLGVQIQSLTEDIAASLGFEEPHGALVGKLTDNSPAERAGMKVGDVIVKVNGDKIEDSRDLARKIASLEPKSDADVTVVRDGSEQNITVRLGRFPGQKKLASLEQGKSDGEELKDLGLSLAPASDYKDAGDEGVVITEVDPDSDAAEKGLRAGDVILDVNGHQVSKPGDIEESVRKARKNGRGAILMRVRSRDQQRFIALPIKTG